MTFEDGGLLSLWSVQPARAGGHGEETTRALLLDGEGEPAEVAEPLLSTEYDEAERQRRATLELHMAEGVPPLRGSGTRIGGTSLDLGELRLETALFRWSLEGRPGIGRYDIWRQPTPGGR